MTLKPRSHALTDHLPPSRGGWRTPPSVEQQSKGLPPRKKLLDVVQVSIKLVRAHRLATHSDATQGPIGRVVIGSRHQASDLSAAPLRCQGLQSGLLLQIGATSTRPKGFIGSAAPQRSASFAQREGGDTVEARADSPHVALPSPSSIRDMPFVCPSTMASGFGPMTFKPSGRCTRLTQSRAAWGAVTAGVRLERVSRGIYSAASSCSELSSSGAVISAESGLASGGVGAPADPPGAADGIEGGTAMPGSVLPP